jgi:serine/threonine-protein kinase PknK
LVTRGRLADALRAAGRRRLILIHGPSGFGKTTLAAQWREELTQDGAAVGWLTVDDDDNNPVWFVVHLLESIRRVRPALAASLCHVLEEHGDDAARYVLTTLIDEIHENDDRIVLVIDDWQRVSDAATTTALGFLLDHGCHHLQLIVTSWSRAGLPISRLRLQDEVVEIDAAALRFHPEEAQSLLNDVGGLTLARNDVDALTTSTDGWAAGLQLATLSLRGGGDAHSLVGRLSGATDTIGDFLAENVLAAVEPEVREFLLTTSITERTCGSLASQLSGITRGQAMLDDTERRGLFLSRTDDDPDWFRYHQMFAEFLRRRLANDRPAEVERLHRVASTWFAEHGYLNDAVDHALAYDPVRAVDLVEQDETNLLEQSKMTTLLAIVDKLPPPIVASRPRLQLVIAWANILLQRPAPAAAALNRFEATLAGSGIAREADLRAEADVLRGVAECFSDRTGGVDDLVAEAMSRPDTFHPRVPGVAGNMAAFAAMYRFEFDTARRHLDWAAPYHEMMGPFASVYACCYGGLAARYQLDIAGAMKSFREAVEIASGIGMQSHASRLAGSLLGQLLYETGELAEASRLLDESYQFGSDGGGVDCLVARYVIGARIKSTLGDRSAAVERLDAGMSAADRLGVPRLAAAVTNERIRLGVSVTAEVADRVRLPRTLSSDDGIATITAELDENSAVRLLAASNSVDEQSQACRRAADLAAGIDGRRRPLASLQADLLLIETLTSTGRADETRTAVAEVRQRCARVGLPQLLVDAGIT